MSHGKIVVTPLRASQILHSLVQMRPLTTYLLKIWSIYLFIMLLPKSKAGLAQSRGTRAWRACAKRRYALVMPSSHHPAPISEGTSPLCRQQGFTKFVSDIELYEIASKPERELCGKNASAIADPARRRETKIKQYQAEKEIRSRIEVRQNPPIFLSPHARKEPTP